MNWRDLKKDCLYRDITTGFVFKVKDIKFQNNNYYLFWRARNKKSLEDRIFKDNVSRINFNNIVEEKDFEKYEN